MCQRSAAHSLPRSTSSGFTPANTTYQPAGETPVKHVVFKYYTNEGNIAMFWHEANCTLRIPKHLNIVPQYCLVVGSATADGPKMVFIFCSL